SSVLIVRPVCALRKSSSRLVCRSTRTVVNRPDVVTAGSNPASTTLGVGVTLLLRVHPPNAVQTMKSTKIILGTRFIQSRPTLSFSGSHATTDKGYSPPSPLQAIVLLRARFE